MTLGAQSKSGVHFIPRSTVKVKMKWGFSLLNLKEQQKSGRSPFTVSKYLFSLQSYRSLVSQQKVAEKAVEINQNQ